MDDENRMTTPPDLSDEQIERHRECLTIYYSSCCDCGSEQAELEALASANALCDQALRVRALENDVRHWKQTAEKWKRLHDDRCEKAAAAEKRAEASAKDAANWKQLAEDYYAEHYHPEYMADGIQRGALDAHFSKLFDAAKEQKRG